MNKKHESSPPQEDDPPLPQRIIVRIWLLAGAALIFFTLSYFVWGWIDLALIPVEGS